MSGIRAEATWRGRLTGLTLTRRREDSAAKHGAPHADVLQLLGRDIERVVLEDCEVGALADVDAAQLLVELQGVGRAQGDGAQRIGHRDLLRLAQGASRRGETVDGAP